ncbi:hypothetical protein HDC92_004403 [Pedobacter sp. AK017]|uniref:alpha-1,2-fucosyltransferase n=1 Tax=Pedobacter sp. AK017 TaxID=2723073 RepID=UPI00160CB284|nr:alpha-1,2-fucosyltransferase [Pedobacter sp. AK017]MBB5440700.1 hypothetical protein [Pedobacter sp. AK017]
MIISKIKEGIGNQLFQYAAARSLSLRHHVPVLMDIAHYFTSAVRKFELGYFNIPGIETNLELYAEVVFGVYKEPHFHYDPTFGQRKGNIYLDGFWQSEKYFKDIRAVLLEELKVKDSYVSHLQPVVNTIKNEHSVAVHIRRGDYVSKRFSDTHGVLPYDYYARAIALLAIKVLPIKLYFFSDDMEWVKDNVVVDHPHEFISQSVTKNHLEDFHLMSQCRHHIIANSSFSWWAAWLNDYPEKQVIAPEKWFNNLPHDTKDLIPETWIKI